jgi:F0F1-type ATP synthase beta subunit
VDLAQTLDGCERILDGSYDETHEGALYMIGDIDEATTRRERA